MRTGEMLRAGRSFGEEGKGGRGTVHCSREMVYGRFSFFADNIRKAAQFPRQSWTFYRCIFASPPCANSGEIRARVFLFLQCLYVRTGLMSPVAEARWRRKWERASVVLFLVVNIFLLLCLFTTRRMCIRCASCSMDGSVWQRNICFVLSCSVTVVAREDKSLG